MNGELARWRLLFERILREREDGDPAHDLGHFRRVWGLAKRLAEAEGVAVDRLVLLAACYLHDLVNMPKDSPERAAASALSAREAGRLLAALDFPADRIGAVAHAIEAHSYSAGIPARTPEARLLQDADRLDALGAVGLARMFAIAGRMGRSVADPDDPFAEHRPLDEVRWSLDHVRTKLERLPGLMNSRTARRMADQRLAFVHAFVERLRVELVEGDPGPPGAEAGNGG